MTAEGLSWRADIDAMAFQPASHGGRCAVHRAAFEAVAADKALRRGYDVAASRHPTSRDVAQLL